MIRNKEYWIARALQRENEAYLRGVGLTAKMFQEYDRAAKAIRRDIGDFYSKYAGKYGLTYDQAVRLLTRKEFQEWEATLGEYIARIAAEPDPRVKALLTAQLDALSTNSRISRLEALLGQIDLKLNELWETGVSQMKAEFGETFREGYYKKVYDIQSRAGFIHEFAKLDESVVENVLSYPWSGAMFSDRLWRNKQALLFHVRETITQGVMQGKSVATMSKELSAKMGQSYKAAERLIRTETTHFHSEADKAAYNAAGVDQYEYIATHDARTCETCAALDGKHFKLKDAQAGANYPPMHPNDRCTTVEYDPDDALDWYNSGQPMPENMTYEDWYRQQVDAHGPGYVEKERQKSYNQGKDAEQFGRYSERLGAGAPSDLDAFQEMKYTDPDAWSNLKSFYSYKGRVPEATKADFDIYNRIKATGFRGTIRVPPAAIDPSTLAFVDAHGSHHGVTLEQAKEYVRTARFSVTRRRWDGVKTNYYSPTGATYVNEEGKINTSFARSDFDQSVEKAMEVFEE